MEPFYLLNKKIQKVIHEMKWENFRSIQDEAIVHLITTPSDVIISAPTASGKTEAAFLPIISQIADTGKDSVKILYISPLKALINDQFLRINDLCKNIDFPITKWHGDANATQKAKLLKNPSGILLITPESIEALFLNKAEYIPLLFKNLDYIVIDEIHSFIGNERGSQLKSLIKRIEISQNIRPIKIALSATISNLEDIAAWINIENPKSVKIIEDSDGDGKKISGLTKCYVNETSEDDVKNNSFMSDLSSDLFKITQKGKNLVFANNKMTLEDYCDTMQELAKKNNFQNNFLIHHGSLAKHIREQCEESLKKEDNISVFCTNTLELGIDIGSIDRILFLDPPFTVAAMKQRLGRCGRKEGASKEFRFFIEEKALNDRSKLDDRLRVRLVQSIAIIELMLENYTEPLDTKTFDYSTFTHQILSFLGQTGGASASDIYRTIAVNSFCSYFSKNDFIELLKSLNEKEVIYQMPDGLITLSRKGEKIVENYEFYAAFVTPEDWIINYNGKEIGQISANNLLFLKEGSQFILAGKRWEVVEIKKDIHTILVKTGYGKKLVKLSDGGQFIGKAIHKKMQKIYETHFIPKYLAPSSAPILQEAFDNYDILIKGENSSVLTVFEGDKVQNTIALLLSYLNSEFISSAIGFIFKEEKQAPINSLKNLDFKTFDIDEIVSHIDDSIKCSKKFDHLLPHALLNKSFIQENFDIEGATAFIETLK